MTSKRETVMLSMLLLLFTGCGLLALAAMVLTWREHGAALLGLREDLRDCADVRNYRFTLITVGPRVSAPAFRPSGFPSRPARRAA